MAPRGWKFVGGGSTAKFSTRDLQRILPLCVCIRKIMYIGSCRLSNVDYHTSIDSIVRMTAVGAVCTNITSSAVAGALVSVVASQTSVALAHRAAVGNPDG